MMYSSLVTGKMSTLNTHTADSEAAAPPLLPVQADRCCRLLCAALILYVVLMGRWTYPITLCLIRLFWFLSSCRGTPQYKQFTYATQKGANQWNYCFAAPIYKLPVQYWLEWKFAIVSTWNPKNIMQSNHFVSRKNIHTLCIIIMHTFMMLLWCSFTRE